VSRAVGTARKDRTADPDSSTKTLAELQTEIIRSAKRGYPILITAAGFFALIAALSRVLPTHTLGLAWLLGMMIIFPSGVVLGRFLGVQLITTDSPLGTLGGLVSGVQGAFIPVFIVIYQFVPQYLPLAVGLLGGAHFLPYAWIYRSRAYWFVTLGTCLSALVIGIGFVSKAYIAVPLSISAVFAISVFWILAENRNDGRALVTTSNGQPTPSSARN
jgi:hypothetical protein